MKNSEIRKVATRCLEGILASDREFDEVENAPKSARAAKRVDIAFNHAEAFAAEAKRHGLDKE